MNLRNVNVALISGVAALGLAACSGTSATTASMSTATSSSTSTSQSSTQSTATNVALGDVAALNDNVESHAETDDGTYDTTGAVAITLADGSSTVTGTGATVDGETVTISAPGTYLLTGSLSDGQIVVDSAAKGKVRLVLDGVTVTNSSGPAVAISAADEAVVILAEGSTNALTDGSGYDTSAQDAPNAALFSMADLTIAGSGALTVTGNTNDGIGSKDGLVILSGDLTVTAQDDGLRGKDYVIIAGGTTTVTAQSDAVKSDNETDDTVGYVAISDGSLTVTAGDDARPEHEEPGGGEHQQEGDHDDAGKKVPAPGRHVALRGRCHFLFT